MTDFSLLGGSIESPDRTRLPAEEQASLGALFSGAAGAVSLLYRQRPKFKRCCGEAGADLG